MPVYEKAPPEVAEIVNQVTEQYHGGLRDAGVTVDLLFARAKTDDNGDPVGAALKLHGYQCAAVIKVNAYKLRVQGHADAEITFDGDRWDEWSPEEKRSLIDHELEHLELKVDRDGKVLRDDIDRPKMRTKLHDHQFGWFDAIARRHGKASFEVQQAERFVVSRRQLYLGGVDWDAEYEDDQESFKAEVAQAFRDAGILAEGGGRRAASSR
jgi:hypothetical protein